MGPRVRRGREVVCSICETTVPPNNRNAMSATDPKISMGAKRARDPSRRPMPVQANPTAASQNIP